MSLTVRDIPSKDAYSVNMPYVSVTICAPGSTTDCKTIDYVLLDTASVGLRVLSSALGSSPALPLQKDGGGNPILECETFVSGYTWGNVRQADVQLGGLTASSLPIQVIGDSAAPTVPATCSGTGTSMDSLAKLGANGILGVGPFLDDAGIYYVCLSGTCVEAVVSASRQVSNPVAALPSDNNGTIIDVPAVSAQGCSIATGSLILGIGTRSNNALGSATVFDLDTAGDLKTVYGGNTVSAFIDSGSNGLFFSDSSIAVCDSKTSASGFFCPTSTLSKSATLKAYSNGAQASISFDIANADTLVKTGNAAFNNVGAPWGGGTAEFDWGMPFFYGRRVFTAISGNTVSGNAAPFVAY
jgi:hypothetical protein